MTTTPAQDFARYCCELLSSVGPCTARPMFGGFGISTGGLTFGLIAWETLYLKVNADTEPQWVAAGCKPFVYEAKGKPMKLNYYSAPDDAMESPGAMAQWARQALDCALKARSAKAVRPRRAATPAAKPASPRTRRPTAPAPKTSARRKSASG
ncbi:TfoX/Sxy family protein [Variovorax terrae]|uniref:TfoX/Sxy family protein n=1 Tax=Variovorax terrae TaxID=2923278 RepID=A0A9X1VX74_9BURK|nr:TfoX/Sxy family protein [Variovorax terrae]MCJ0764875.1 TfoX/Sxy family protein [Variovorax terrae]